MMNSVTQCEQKDLFSATECGTRRLVLDLTGNIPSFKNNKMILPPSTKRLRDALKAGNLEWARSAMKDFLSKRTFLITKPEYQKEMDRMIDSIVLQLRCAFQTDATRISQASSIRSWTASSMPADDWWERIPDIQIRGELCEPGREGATVVVERLR